MVVEKLTSNRPNGTSVSILLMEWVGDHSPDSLLVVKVSDDTYTNVPAVLGRLDWFTNSTGDFFGRVVMGQDADARPVPHLEGCAYFFKAQAARTIQPEFMEVRTDPREELFITGLAARRAHLNLVHVDDVAPCSVPGTGSPRRWLTRHPVAPGNMYTYFVNDLPT